MSGRRPARVIHSIAPTRICDTGGWTDTWFARYGKVFNIAVQPGAAVRLLAFPRHRRPYITIRAEDYGDVYSIEKLGGAYGRHPLLEAAFDYLPPDADLAIEVSVRSNVPPGAATGTSAAVTVALLGALDLLRGRRLTVLQLAAAAHEVETRLLGQQSGVQDQIAAAFGGLNLIDIDAYPHATVTALRPSEPIWRALEDRLALVFVGRAHRSSEVHERVVRDLQDAGPESPALCRLRQAAAASAAAVMGGDLDALGAAMIENTEAQRALHPALVEADHARVIEVARSHGAAGWKVNGAGGDGGSVTLLCDADSLARRRLLEDIEAADPSYRVIPIRLDPKGVRVWEGDEEPN